MSSWMICKSLAVHHISLLHHGMTQTQSRPIANQVGPLRNTATLQPGQHIYMRLEYCIYMLFIPTLYILNIGLGF